MGKASISGVRSIIPARHPRWYSVGVSTSTMAGHDLAGMIGSSAGHDRNGPRARPRRSLAPRHLEPSGQADGWRWRPGLVVRDGIGGLAHGPGALSDRL